MSTSGPRSLALPASVVAFVAIAAVASPARAQTGTVSVTVTDRATSQPLEAVRVQVGTTQLGGATDLRGRVIIRAVPVGPQTLRLTRIGYRPESQTVTVAANDTARVTASMGASAVELSQVVVTGTGGAVEKRKVGASLASVDVAQLAEQIPTVSVQSLLSSKVAGLRSQTVGGGVGSGQDLRIRGISSFTLNQRPAVYIDGVRVDTKGTEWAIGSIACCSFTGGNSTDRMSDLNPNDIDHIEVLKGAAAATLYGSEATNGVIQIFTKKGRSTDARAQWNLGIGTGIDRLRENLPTKQFPRFTGPDGTRALDANDLIKSGPYSAVDLSAQGGTARSTYFISGLVSKEVGSIQPNDQVKGNLRLNLTFLPTDKITIESRSSYTRNKVNELQAGNNWTALLGNAINGNPRNATKQKPYGEAWVPVSDIETMSTLSDADRWTGGVTIQHQLTSALSQRLILGLDAVNDQKSRFFPFSGAFGPAGVVDGQRNLGNRTYRTYTVDYLASLNFNLPFGIESALSAGAQGFWENERLGMAIGNKFPGPGVSVVSSAALYGAAEQYTETINMGFLAQDRFSWKDKLFTTLGIRIDGNSAFGQDYGFQKYPKADVSYDLSKDGFLPKVVSAFRIRGAVGKAGKMPGAFDSFTSFAASPVYKDVSGIIPANPGNADLRPETSLEREGGFEIGLWSDRLGIEGSLYHQRTEDAIFQLPNPPSAGFRDQRRVNIGRVDNHGWEGSVNYLVTSRKMFDWTTGIRVDGNHNKVIDLGGVNTGSVLVREGYPVQGVWGRKATGFSVTTGGTCPSYGCPVTTRSDTNVYYGAPLPTFNGSWQNQVRIGPFQLYGLLSMERGAWLSNGDRAYRIRQGGSDEYLQFLGADGSRTFKADSVAQYASILDYFDKRDNVRLKEVSLTYALPLALSNRMRVGRTVITVSGQNLMWWDECNCVDPNMTWAGATGITNINSGFLAQPSPRIFRVQLRTKF